MAIGRTAYSSPGLGDCAWVTGSHVSFAHPAVKPQGYQASASPLVVPWPIDLTAHRADTPASPYRHPQRRGERLLLDRPAAQGLFQRRLLGAALYR
jgi:hypothetical protein